ncbi:MAG: tetratricopeptide repeat protein [Planctomycetes bacterium]|nr:tetratricopeptide repeat protein [Planctomycetota bacterium]
MSGESNLPTLPRDFDSLLRAGRYRQAFAAIAPNLEQLGAGAPLEVLRTLHLLCLRLGFDARRRWLGRRILQRWPDRLAARANHVRDLLRRGFVLQAWEQTRQPQPAALDPAEQVDWLLAQARVSSQLRDFAAAEAGFAAAEAVMPGHLDIVRERAWTRQDQDDLTGALAVLEAALEQSPEEVDLRLQRCWLRHDRNDPGVGELLRETRALVESPVLDGVHANHCLEHGDLATARSVWTALLAEPHHERRVRLTWRFALMRTCRDLGDDEAALALMRDAGRYGTEEVARLQAHLANPQASPERTRTRVVLPVPFVRQDHLTCSPATMASLLATFGVHEDQREIARQITVDGTASHDEMVWAEARGLVVRWFQFDADIARQLLDRGLPFAITTRFESSSHRQALVGYDRVLDTFILRDPTGNFRREVPTAWLERVARRGGECALLLPAEVAARHELPALPLEHETLQWMRAKLEWRERRPQAAEARLVALGELPPGPLRLDVELRLARERGDRRRELELWRTKWEEEPEDSYWRYHHIAELIDQNRWQDARQLLESWAPATRSPFLLQMLADQWRFDARRRADAEWVVRRSLRWTSREGRSWHRLARIVGSDPARAATAAELTRLAAGLQPFDEWLAVEHYRQLRNLGRAEEGLGFLRDRQTVRGGRSGPMAMTYAEALEEQHQPEPAVAVLRASLTTDDDAAQVRLRLFSVLHRLHRLDEAAAVLAEPGLRPIDEAWCRHKLAVARGDHAAAARALDDCLAADPWHEGAQALRLDHLLEHDGLPAARAAAETLAAASAMPPFLLVKVAEFLERIEAHDAADALLRRLVAEHPHEHWLAGRLSRRLLHRGRFDEARPLLAELRQSSPDSSPLWCDIGLLSHHDGDLDAARAAVRQAFVLEPANSASVRRLLDWAPDPAVAQTDLRFVLDTLVRRPVPPDFDVLVGLLDVLPMLPDAEGAAFFHALASAHPQEIDHRMAHIEFVGRKDPATAAQLAATLAAERPWQSGHPLRHAKFLRELGRQDEECAVLEALLQRDPGCAQAYVELGESLEQRGLHQQALQVLERGRQRVPGYSTLHGMLANTAWRLGDRERALAAVARATELDADYRWAWFSRCEWLIELDRHAEALAIAERLVADRPRQALAHEVHAEVLEAVGQHDERVEALRRALALQPRLGSSRLRLCDALIDLKRFDDARSVIAEGQQLLGDRPELALRLATIERTAGNHEAARKMLRAALDRHPDHRDGWVSLLSWYEQEGRHHDILQLAKKPPAVLERDAVLFGYAADSELHLGNTAAGETWLRRALELAPSYSWARHKLCELALDRRAPQEVLDLLGDHQDPDSQPFASAVLIAKAAGMRGDVELAGRAFARLMKQPDANSAALGDVDKLLRNKMSKQHKALLERLAASAEPGGVVVRNLARVHGLRGEGPAFWSLVGDIHTALGPGPGLVAVTELFASLSHHLDDKKLAGWVREHVVGPVEDRDTMGRLMYVLNNKAGDAESLRLFGDHWRRTDLRGYMMANFGDSMRRLGRFDEMVAVAEFALSRLPHDHSIWWHRRNLAEAAMRRRDFAAVRELCVMPVRDHPGQRLVLHQLDLIAELRSARWWRRFGILQRRLDEALRRYDAARLDSPESTTPSDLRGRELFAACPWPTTLLMCLGKPGLGVLRLFAP